MSSAADFAAASPGMIFEHAGFDLPPGFLWADGSAVSRTTYSRLFGQLTRSVTGNITSGNATITGVSKDLSSIVTQGMPISGPGIPAGATVSGITATTITLSANATSSSNGSAVVIAPYGVGDGSTTFNVPDHRGRGAVGRDNMGGTAANRMTTAGSGVHGVRIGATGGAETHTLSVAQMPTHSHGVNDPAHYHSDQSWNMSNFDSTGGANPVGADNGAGGALGNNIYSDPAYTGISIQNNGSGQAHNNVQPTLVANYIIKT